MSGFRCEHGVDHHSSDRTETCPKCRNKTRDFVALISSITVPSPISMRIGNRYATANAEHLIELAKGASDFLLRLSPSGAYYRLKPEDGWSNAVIEHNDRDLIRMADEKGWTGL